MKRVSERASTSTQGVDVGLKARTYVDFDARCSDAR